MIGTTSPIEQTTNPPEAYFAEATQAEQDLQRVAAEQDALRRAAILVASGASPREVFDAITTSASELFEVPFASLLRFGPDEMATMVAGCAACSGFVGQTWTVPDDDPGIVRTVVGSRRPARIEDHSGVHGPLGEAARSLGIGSVVGVPVIVDDSVWGVLAVGAAQDGPPLPADAGDRLDGFTELVTTTLISAETRDSLHRLADEQAALRRVATLAARESSAAELLEAAALEAARIMDVDTVVMFRFEPDETATLVAQSEKLSTASSLRTSLTLEGENVVAWVHRTGQSARMDDWQSATGSVAALADVLGFRSAVASPIIAHGRLWGTMVAAMNRGQPLPADTKARSVEFAELLGTAITGAENRAELNDSEARAHDLAAQQAALRRVAVLVAEGASEAEIFEHVAREISQVLDHSMVTVDRYESDESSIVVASINDPGFPVGSRWPLEGPSLGALVLQTGRPARIDEYAELESASARVMRDFSVASAVGVPIMVDGRVWGIVCVGTTGPTPLAEETEARLADFTELLATAISNAESREALTRLADEQAALRRVATLVAQGASPDELFSAVALEVAFVVDIPVVAVNRYETDGSFTIMGIAGETGFTVGSRWPVDEEGIAGMILATGRPSRRDDYSTMPGRLGEAVREDLMVSTLGVPIVVAGRIWGFMVAAAKPGRPIPADTAERLARFTELVATAVSNATTRTELVASRARIVATADEARRRIERDLHDGTQQQLVALGLDLQVLRAKVPAELEEPHRDLESIGRALDAMLENVREISRGVHPSVLSNWGLDAALQALALRSSVPVELDVEVLERLPQSIEIAAFYSVSEALANAAKHAAASGVCVTAAVSSGRLCVTVRDDGVGGADMHAGSGLTGLVDRVEALGGRLQLASPPGKGTTVSIDLPLVVTADTD